MVSFAILMDEALTESARDHRGGGRGAARRRFRSAESGRLLSQLHERTAGGTSGLTPLQDQLARIQQLNSIEQVVEHFGYLQHVGVQTPIGYYVDQDDKDSTQYLVAIVQSGTTLPDRDYYLGGRSRST